MNVFGLGVGIGVGFGFGVAAACLTTARFSTVGDASGDAVGDGGAFDEFSSTFGDSIGSADSIGLGETAGVGLSAGVDSRVGLATGTTV
jgi:hypothetical protein